MSRLALALIFCLSSLSGLSLAQAGNAKVGGRFQIASQLPQALRKALMAYGKLRYSGTRTVEFKSKGERERHTEYVTTDGYRSRVEFPPESALSGQVIVETPTERRHFTPGNNELRVLPPRREEALGRIAGLAKRRVTFNQQPGGTVAGIATQLVAVSDPKGNVIQKLWIDPNSGMVLKRELYDRGGAIQGYFEFTKVNLNPQISATEFRLQPKGVRLVTPENVLDRLIKKGGFRDVRLTGTAYRLEAARVQKLGGQQVLVQLYLGNGHRISLYQLRAQVDTAKLDSQATGTLNAFSWQQQGSTFALIGDLSDKELHDLSRRLGA